MKYSCISLILAAILVSGPTTSHCRDIVLGVGQSLNLGDTQVICVDQGAPEPLRIKECQFWDAYKEKCLYQRETVTFGKAQCVNECQHWDEYSKRCMYATLCEFKPFQKVFIQTRCLQYDDYAQKCLRISEKRVGGLLREGLKPLKE